MPIDPVGIRDAGLRRVSWLTRGAVACGVALTGAFSAVAATAFPGRSVRRVAEVPPTAEAPAPPAVDTTEPPTTVPSAAVAARPPAATAQRTLRPPLTAPRPVVQAPAPTLAPRPHLRPQVVSGGS